MERHELEIIRRSVVMAQDSAAPLPADTIFALIRALEASELSYADFVRACSTS